MPLWSGVNVAGVALKSLDPKLGTDKGRFPIKVVKAATEELQFLLEKKKKIPSQQTSP